MKKMILPLLILVLFSGCATEPESKPMNKTEKARMYVQAANGAIIEGDPTGALEHLAAAEELDPTLPELHHSRALAFFAKKDTASALASVQRALELKPNYSDANNTFGKLLLDQGLFQQAEQPLLKAAADSLYRDAYKAQTNLGILYYKTEKWEKSRKFFQDAINNSPHQACVAYYYRGHLWLKESQFDRAIQDYEKATTKFCGSFADAYFALGIAFSRNKQYEQAKKKFLEIQKLYPDTELAKKAMDRLRYLP